MGHSNAPPRPGRYARKRAAGLPGQSHGTRLSRPARSLSRGHSQRSGSTTSAGLRPALSKRASGAAEESERLPRHVTSCQTDEPGDSHHEGSAPHCFRQSRPVFCLPGCGMVYRRRGAAEGPRFLSSGKPAEGGVAKTWVGLVAVRCARSRGFGPLDRPDRARLSFLVDREVDNRGAKPLPATSLGASISLGDKRSPVQIRVPRLESARSQCARPPPLLASLPHASQRSMPH
jgi:hypothetical protein